VAQAFWKKQKRLAELLLPAALPELSFWWFYQHCGKAKKP